MWTSKYVGFLELMIDIQSNSFSSLSMMIYPRCEPRIGKESFASHCVIVEYLSARTITAENNQNNNHFDHDDEEEELMRLKQQERTKSRTSRPASAATRKNSISSRPNSVAMFQHPLYVNIANHSNHLSSL